LESCFPANTQKPVKLFFEDEARFGRINNLSKCWVNRKDRAIVNQQIIREYIYAYTTVCPATGETFSIISPQNDTQAMTVFLKHLSRSFIQYNIVIVLDSAGWHRSKALQIPKNISLIHLPPYSPELNPVEHIWDYIREQKGFNNHSFNSLDDVESQLMAALKEINQKTKR
jgi:putative transposase